MIIDLGNGLAPNRCQAIIWTNDNTVQWCFYASPGLHVLTHWGRVTHICVSKLIIIGSDNGLSPVRPQVIIWTNAGILLIGPLRTNFSEISIEIHIFSFKKMHLKMSSGNWQPSCVGLNVLMTWKMVGKTCKISLVISNCKKNLNWWIWPIAPNNCKIVQMKMQYISVAWCMTAVSPVCWQWGYHGLALSYQNVRWNTMIICKVSSIFCSHHTAPVEDAPSFISFSYIYFYPCDAVLCRDDRNRYQVCWYFGGGIYNRHSICRHSVISNLFSLDIMSLSCEIAIRQIS